MVQISLIIPVYNSELYIEKCLISCLHQNIESTQYEIVVINDGSTDKSANIIDKFKFHPNLKIFNLQKNLGLGEARNLGLKYASGKYIWFIDSDDWIAENCLSNLLVELGQAEVIRILSTEIFKSSNFQEKIFSKKNYIVSGIDYMKNDFRVCVQFYIFKFDFLLRYNLFFKSVIFEDFEFMPRALFYSQNFKIINSHIYFRLIHQNSLMRTVSLKKPYHILEIILSLKYFYLRNVKSENQIIFHRLISLALNNFLHNTFVHDEKNQLIFKNLLKKNNLLYIHFLKSRKFKYLIEGIIFFISSNFLFYCYKSFYKLKKYFKK